MYTGFIWSTFFTRKLRFWLITNWRIVKMLNSENKKHNEKACYIAEDSIMGAFCKFYILQLPFCLQSTPRSWAKYSFHAQTASNLATLGSGLDESPAVMVQPLILVTLLRIFKFPTNTANILLLTAADWEMIKHSCYRPEHNQYRNSINIVWYFGMLTVHNNL